VIAVKQHSGGHMTPRKWPDDVDPTNGKHIGVVTSWRSEESHGIIQALLANGNLLRVSVSADDIVSNLHVPFLVPGEEVELMIEVNTYMLIARHVSGPQNSCVQCDDSDADKFEIVLR